jgi:predicted SnoaL-like aldol condensation-catalyzing enzyme
MASSTEQNKAVVSRFITEVLQGGKLDLVDELLAPNYVNPGMGNADRDHFKGILTAFWSVAPHFHLEEFVAEGDSVVARFTLELTQAGSKITARGLAYYKLADGKIVEDDPITSPELAQMLAPQIAAMANA